MQTHYCLRTSWITPSYTHHHRPSPYTAVCWRPARGLPHSSHPQNLTGNVSWHFPQQTSVAPAIPPMLSWLLHLTLKPRCKKLSSPATLWLRTEHFWVSMTWPTWGWTGVWALEELAGWTHTTLILWAAPICTLLEMSHFTRATRGSWGRRTDTKFRGKKSTMA